jgi:hypothetical protein
MEIGSGTISPARVYASEPPGGSKLPEMVGADQGAEVATDAMRFGNGH